MCLWNDDYLFVGCEDHEMKLVKIKERLVVKKYCHESQVLTIKKIVHPKYGESLISQGIHEIKYWIK